MRGAWAAGIELSGTDNRTKRKAQCKTPRRTRLALEPLESRWCLSTYTVNSIADLGAGSGSAGDLRYCIAQANANSGANTIRFAPSVFATHKTITLGGTQLELRNTSGATTITGPTAGVTINGNNASRVFQIDANVTASISGLTITGGNANAGRLRIYNSG